MPERIRRLLNGVETVLVVTPRCGLAHPCREPSCFLHWHVVALPLLTGSEVTHPATTASVPGARSGVGVDNFARKAF